MSVEFLCTTLLIRKVLPKLFSQLARVCCRILKVQSIVWSFRQIYAMIIVVVKAWVRSKVFYVNLQGMSWTLSFLCWKIIDGSIFTKILQVSNNDSPEAGNDTVVKLSEGNQTLHGALNTRRALVLVLHSTHSSFPVGSSWRWGTWTLVVTKVTLVGTSSWPLPWLDWKEETDIPVREDAWSSRFTSRFLTISNCLYCKGLLYVYVVR